MNEDQNKTREQLLEELPALRAKIAALERSETSLRESEEWYHALFDHSLDAILLTRPDGSILDANPAACRMFGLNREGLIAAGRSGLVDATDSCLEAALKRRTELGEGIATLTMIRANGERFPVEITSALFADGSGQQKSSMIIRDITDRRRAEEALRQRDVLFEKLSFHVPGMVYQFMRRPDGTYCVPFTTGAIQDVFGCAPEEVHDHFGPLAKAIYPEDMNRVIASIEASAARMTTWQCEYRVQLPGQPIRWMLGNSTPEKLADGSIIWHGFITDITDRKKAEEALRESETRYRQIAENMADVVWTADLHFITTYASPSVERMLGEPVEAHLKRRVEEKLPPESLGQIHLLLQEEMEKENDPGQDKDRARLIEVQHYRADGTKMWAQMNISFVRDAEGKAIGIQGVTRDITERKQAEELLRKREQELMLKSQNIEEANTALKLLLKHIEDDKKEQEENILTNIRELVLPYLGKLKNTMDHPEANPYLNVIEAHLQSIVSPFLNRLKARYLNLTPRELEVATLIREGKRTKEIASMLGISARAIDSHRDSIRHKFGMKNKKINLRTYLMSLQ